MVVLCDGARRARTHWRLLGGLRRGGCRSRQRAAIGQARAALELRIEPSLRRGTAADADLAAQLLLAVLDTGSADEFTDAVARALEGGSVLRVAEISSSGGGDEPDPRLVIEIETDAQNREQLLAVVHRVVEIVAVLWTTQSLEGNGSIKVGLNLVADGETFTFDNAAMRAFAAEFAAVT